MAKKRKPTADDVYDRRYLRNDPESSNLDAAELAVFEAARSGVALLKKTFDTWVTIGRGVVLARDRANRIGGGKTFRRILEQQGLAAVVPPATATRLEAIIARLSEVEAWRAALSDTRRFNWSSPSAVYKHCPLFARPEGSSQPPMRKTPRPHVQVAIDTVADYVRDLAPDERAAILGQIGIAAPREDDTSLDEKRHNYASLLKSLSPDEQAAEIKKLMYGDLEWTTEIMSKLFRMTTLSFNRETRPRRARAETQPLSTKVKL
jgi:hypothetical protein